MRTFFDEIWTHHVSLTVVLFLSLALSLALAAAVLFWTQRQRVHIQFSLLALNAAAWAAGVLWVVHSHEEATAWVALKTTFAITAFLPAVLYHFIVYFPHNRFEGSRAALWIFYAAGAVQLYLMNTSWYVDSLTVYAAAPPVVHYGPVMTLYAVQLGSAFVLTYVSLFNKWRAALGLQRRQIEHVFLGILVATLCGLATNVLAPIAGISSGEPYGPSFVVFMMMVFAYSMVRYQLLDLRLVISRTILYTLLTLFVTLTFMLSVVLVHGLFQERAPSQNLPTTIVAALIVVLLLQPAKERIQLVLDRLIVHRRYDAKALIERIIDYVSRLGNRESIFKRLSEDLQKTLGCTDVHVFMIQGKDVKTAHRIFSTSGLPAAPSYTVEALREYFRDRETPVTLEEVLHGRMTPQRYRVAEEMRYLAAQAVVPLRLEKTTGAFMALGPKVSGDMYTALDIEVLSTVAKPLAISLQNALLFERLEELNVHLERLMANMRAAIVAIDLQGTITTVNQEAKNLFGKIQPGDTVETLPRFVQRILMQTLQQRRGFREVQATLRNALEENVPVALSTSPLISSQGELLGAMVLIFDLTLVKQMESNIRRADRLGNVGTIAATLAHEIKNPLQSIKTFAQLLPYRYDDADFRRTFVEVVPPEVDRIDHIVARLLDVARPKPACFTWCSLGDIVQDVFALVNNVLEKSGISVEVQVSADCPLVLADAEQMKQVFLNLLLNAIDAVQETEVRRIAVRMYPERVPLRQDEWETPQETDCVTIKITDTGTGIPQEEMSKLFTPFHTTKNRGTGIGLFVVHTIIRQHGGTIDICSAVQQGTTVTIVLPVVQAHMAVEGVIP
jgi:PAS domain S-box-containing protein